MLGQFTPKFDHGEDDSPVHKSRCTEKVHERHVQVDVRQFSMDDTDFAFESARRDHVIHDRGFQCLGAFRLPECWENASKMQPNPAKTWFSEPKLCNLQCFFWAQTCLFFWILYVRILICFHPAIWPKFQKATNYIGFRCLSSKKLQIEFVFVA